MLHFTEARGDVVAVALVGPHAKSFAPHSRHTTSPLYVFLQAICPSCHPANSVRALQLIIYAIYGE